MPHLKPGPEKIRLEINRGLGVAQALHEFPEPFACRLRVPEGREIDGLFPPAPGYGISRPVFNDGGGNPRDYCFVLLSVSKKGFILGWGRPLTQPAPSTFFPVGKAKGPCSQYQKTCPLLFDLKKVLSPDPVACGPDAGGIKVAVYPGKSDFHLRPPVTVDPCGPVPVAGHPDVFRLRLVGYPVTGNPAIAYPVCVFPVKTRLCRRTPPRTFGVYAN